MVFQSLGVDRGGSRVDADREQESVHDVVSFATGVGEPTPLGGEPDGPVRLGRDEAVAFQTLDGPDDRDVRDAEPAGEVDHPAVARGVGEFGDRLAVVLGDL